MKKIFRENDVEAVLRRLDRLTLDEARATSAQTLSVVYDLVQNMRVVMDGEQLHYAYLLPAVEYSSLQSARHQWMVSDTPSVRSPGD